MAICPQRRIFEGRSPGAAAGLLRSALKGPFSVGGCLLDGGVNRISAATVVSGKAAGRGAGRTVPHIQGTYPATATVTGITSCPLQSIPPLLAGEG